MKMTLRNKLKWAGLVQRPDLSVTHQRVSLCQTIQAYESKVLDLDHPKIEEARTILGWTAPVFQRFVRSPLVTHSSPHSGMNVFAPNLAHPWLHSVIQRESAHLFRSSDAPIHLRTVVTHNNLGDLKYRPYAWWHRSPSGEIVQSPLFSRGHSSRHKALISQLRLSLPTKDCSALDARALEVASVAKNFAYQSLIYRSYLEVAAGIHLPGEKLDVPLDLINAWSFSTLVSTEQRERWIQYFGPVRRLGASGELEILEGAPQELDFLFSSNYMNFAQIYRLGISLITGGKKMASYVPEMHSLIESFFKGAPVGVRLPELLIMNRFPWKELFNPTSHDLKYLEEKGITLPFAVIASDLGSSARSSMDSLLDQPFANFMEQESEGGSGVQALPYF